METLKSIAVLLMWFSFIVFLLLTIEEREWVLGVVLGYIGLR